VVLCLCGEVDAGVVSNFERDYGPEPVAIDVINAGAVTFIGSVGVAFLVRWVRAARNAGATAVLHQSSPALDRILELTKLNDIIGRPAGGG
jgi:anti-anti-sigma factor